ncbi:MAG: nitroreductase family protein [Thermodesulfobacteriota bacterium]|jgi:nitroreductase
MEFDQVIQTRRSIRNFKPDPVSDKAIFDILEAARLAASGSNIQPWRFIVIRSPEMKEKLKKATVFGFALKAPVIIACCTDLSALDGRPDRALELFQAGVFDDVEVDGEYTPPERNQEQVLTYLNMNVGIAITHMMLKAVDLGLGTCWIGGFDPLKTKEILALDDNLHVVALLPIGYPKRIPAQRPRFPLKKLIVKTV